MREVKKRVGFFLQRRKKWEGKRDLDRPVVLSFNYHGNRLYTLTGVKISDNNWDDKKQRVKLAVKRAGKVNEYLDQLDEKVNDAYYGALATGVTVTNAYILDRLKDREKAEANKSFWDHYDEYLDLKKRGKEGTYKTLVTSYNGFKEFCDEKKITVTFASIEPKLLAEYNDHLLASRNNNNNTVNSQLKRLKRFMNAAYKLGLHTNQKYKEYSVPETVGPIKFLTVEEVKMLAEVKLTSVTEQKVRDLMLMEIYTGQRIGDLQKLNKADIMQHRFDNIPEIFHAAHITTQKTSTATIVPLLPEARAILKKYENDPGELALPKLSLALVNEVIKTVARKAGINALQKVETVKGNVRDTKYVEKWRVLSTHVGRKTFITIAATRGMPINIVASITSQHPQTIMKHYLGVLGPEKFKAMAEKMKF